MEVSSQHISELRERFLSKLEAEGTSIPGGIHPLDLARVQNSDDWLRRFLLHNDLDMKESLTMLWETCKWRKTFGTNELNEKTVKIEYLEDGSMFSYSQDKDGKILFVLKCKKHIKGQRDFEELKKCMVYWFERIERQNNGDMITIFFDMADTGLSNLDMEHTKYIISLFKQYYPYFLNYILIFEMPWILNAAFKVIKTWLPEKAVQKIKFVTKATLKEYVELDRAMTCWGGRDDYVFTFVPEDRSDNSASDDRNGKQERKVHFADNQKEFSSPGTDSSSGPRLKISPSEYITFNSEGSEMSAALNLTNIDEKIISYKIKTTSPEKYRVRPSSGTLKPNASVSISLNVHQGYQSSALTRDKFLIMGIPVESADLSAEELTDVWKQSGIKSVEHRLKCCISGAGGDASTRNGGLVGNYSPGNEMGQLLKNVSDVMEANARIESKLLLSRQLECAILILLFVLGIGLMYVVYLLRKDFDEPSPTHEPHLDL